MHFLTIHEDDESLELISQLVSSKMKVVLIVTFRPEEILPEKIRSIIQPPEAEGISESPKLCLRKKLLMEVQHT